MLVGPIALLKELFKYFEYYPHEMHTKYLFKL